MKLFSLMVLSPLLITACGSNEALDLAKMPEVAASQVYQNDSPDAETASENTSNSNNQTTGSNDPTNLCEPVAEPRCAAGRKPVAIRDTRGCGEFVCALDQEAKPAPSFDDEEGDLQSLPKEPVVETNQTCRIHIRSGDYRYIAPNIGYTRYSPLVTSRFSPEKGRYREGVSMVCERSTVVCGVSGKVFSYPRQARYLVNRNRSRCNAQIFHNKPLHNYQQYGQWYLWVKDLFEVCRNRKPTDAEVTQHLEDFVERGKSESTIATAICSQ